MFEVHWHSAPTLAVPRDDITVNPLLSALKAEPDLWGIVSSTHGPRSSVALPRPSTITSVDRKTIGMLYIPVVVRDLASHARAATNG